MPSDSLPLTTTARTHRLRDSMRFLGRFLQSPGSVGAILPSSRYLADKMVGDLDLKPGDLVVEYGPGTGPMTKAIQALDLEKQGVGYVGIELDPKFHAALAARFAGMQFHLGSVVDVEQILVDREHGKARAIISGLPFASLPPEIQLGVVDGTHAVLAAGGEFRTFQYVHAYGMKSAQRFRAMMRERFGDCERSRPVLRNVPPAYVLTYRK